MASSLLFPVLNKSFTTYKGPPWYLSSETSVRSLTIEEYGLVFRDTSVYYRYPLAEKKTKRIRIDNIDSEDVHRRATEEYIKISFLFNYFRNNHPVLLALPMHLSTIRKTSFKGIIELDYVGDLRRIMDQSYRLKPDTTKGTLNEFMTVLTRVLEQNKHVLITLSRFNSALLKQNPFDRIVDLTIALESLIDGNIELAHRFSVYNAWSAERDTSKREETYKLLKNLYSARSEIVHGGSSDKRIKKAQGSWDKLLSIARNALGYYLLYLYDHSLNGWHQHQKNLELGKDQRVN